MPFRKRDAVELVRRIKPAILQHGIEFKIGPNLGFVQIVLSFAHLFGIRLPIVRRQSEAALLAINDGLNLSRSDFAFAVAAGTSESIKFKAASGVFGIWSSMFQAAKFG